MTTRDFVDSLSTTLLNDDRVLSAGERELLINLLQRANGSEANRSRPVKEVIARAVGETIAQRAYEILGESVSRRLLDSAGAETGKSQAMESPPLPPSPAPGPPGPRPSYAGESRMESRSRPPLPPSPAPGPPGSPPSRTAEKQRSLAEAETRAVAVLDAPEVAVAQCVVFDEFLAAGEMQDLLEYTLRHEAQFELSEVISPSIGGTVDFDCRRSRVLMDLEKHQNILVNRVHACMARVMARLGQPAFSTSHVEAQITASNDGDFFRWHSDSGHPETSSREITFVYFFHREPKQFRGGELRIYDSRLEHGIQVPAENYRAIIPRQNQVVFFPSSLTHEITPVECPSKAFADSRFTVNGWFHR